MPNNPLVSVIVPTYGRPEFLNESIVSVINQTYDNIEILVIDDCSPAPVAVPTNDQRTIRVIRHACNQGPGAARNTGLAHATGDFITFLDDDDLFDQDRIRLGVEQIGDARFHAVRTNLDGRRFEGDLRETLHHGGPPFLQQTLLRREDAIQFDPTLRVAEDIDWWLRQRDRATFSWSDMPGLWYRQHDSERPGVDSFVHLRCRELVAFRHAPYLDPRSRSHQFNRVSVSAMATGNRPKTIGYALRSILAKPSVHGAKLLVRGLTPFSNWARP